MDQARPARDRFGRGRSVAQASVAREEPTHFPNRARSHAPCRTNGNVVAVMSLQDRGRSLIVPTSDMMDQDSGLGTGCSSPATSSDGTRNSSTPTPKVKVNDLPTELIARILLTRLHHPDSSTFTTTDRVLLACATTYPSPPNGALVLAATIPKFVLPRAIRFKRKDLLTHMNLVSARKLPARFKVHPLDYASALGDTDVLSWIVELFPGLRAGYQDGMAVEAASRSGSIDVLKWWELESGSNFALPKSVDALVDACMDGHVNVVKLWIRHDPNYALQLIDRASTTNNPVLMDRLAQATQDMGDFIGDLDMIASILSACKHGQVHILDFWAERASCAEHAFQMTPRALDAAMSNGHDSVLDWFVNHGLPLAFTWSSVANAPACIREWWSHPGRVLPTKGLDCGFEDSEHDAMVLMEPFAPSARISIQFPTPLNQYRIVFASNGDRRLIPFFSSYYEVVDSLRIPTDPMTPSQWVADNILLHDLSLAERELESTIPGSVSRDVATQCITWRTKDPLVAPVKCFAGNGIDPLAAKLDVLVSFVAEFSLPLIALMQGLPDKHRQELVRLQLPEALVEYLEETRGDGFKVECPLATPEMVAAALAEYI